jgi:YggT family protein
MAHSLADPCTGPQATLRYDALVSPSGRAQSTEKRMVLLVPIVNVIDIILGLYWWVIIISVVMSWLVQFNVINTHNRFVYMVGSAVNQLTDPFLRQIRRYVPAFGGLDFSPILLLLGRVSQLVAGRLGRAPIS